MAKSNRMGGSLPKLNYGPTPADPTRVVQTPSYPPDQSIYSNPITSSQSSVRNPSGTQIGASPAMNFISPNTLPTSKDPQTTPNVNPNNVAN